MNSGQGGVCVCILVRQPKKAQGVKHEEWTAGEHGEVKEGEQNQKSRVCDRRKAGDKFPAPVGGSYFPVLLSVGNYWNNLVGVDQVPGYRN